MFNYLHSIRKSVQMQVENEIDVRIQQNGRAYSLRNSDGSLRFVTIEEPADLRVLASFSVNSSNPPK